MKKSRFILAAAAIALMAAFAGCGKSDGGSPDNPTPKTFTVTFVSNGGSEVAPQSVAEGELATEPTAPSRSNYVFAGWFIDDSNFTDKWDFATRTVSTDVTLYAKWTVVVPADGVMINGVVWAKCNVDAFGTFAAAPDASGMFYQWNRPKAWPATGAVTGWDSTTPSGDTWAAANDPCPTGWRVPTSAEQGTLLNTTNVSSAWTTLNGVNGRIFTDKVSGASIFFPAAGSRYHSSDGALGYAGYLGYYWSSSPCAPDLVWSLTFDGGIGGIYQSYTNYRTLGFSVRCVRQ